MTLVSSPSGTGAMPTGSKVLRAKDFPARVKEPSTGAFKTVTLQAGTAVLANSTAVPTQSAARRSRVIQRFMRIAPSNGIDALRGCKGQRSARLGIAFGRRRARFLEPAGAAAQPIEVSSQHLGARHAEQPPQCDGAVGHRRDRLGCRLQRREVAQVGPRAGGGARGLAGTQGLLGRAPAHRAEVRRLVAWFDGKFEREVTQNLLYEKMVKRLLGQGGPDSGAIRAGKANIRIHLDYISWLTDRRNWLAGDDFSLADIAAAAQISAIDYLGDVAWDQHRDAAEWYARVKSRPSFRQILADTWPGTQPPSHYADLDF